VVEKTAEELATRADSYSAQDGTKWNNIRLIQEAGPD